MLSSIASTLTGATTAAPTPRPEDGPAAETHGNGPSSSSSSSGSSPGPARMDQPSGDRYEASPQPSDRSRLVATDPTYTFGLAVGTTATTTSPPTTPVAPAPAVIVKQGIVRPDDRELRNPESHHLRRAEPHHLPSHPPPGLTRLESASAAAASLAHAAPPKPPFVWKPSPSSAASAAACLAHAGREAGGLRDSPSPSRIESDGSAHNPKESWSLRGARGAMGLRGANRHRSGSSPADLGAGDSDAVGPHTKRDSGFVTGADDDEIPAHAKQKSDVLNAATASMANERLKHEEAQPPPKPLYDDSGPSPSRTGVPRRRNYPHLEEAARLRAEERLARLGYGPRGIRGARSLSLDSCNSPLRGRTIWELDGDAGPAERCQRGQDALLLMSTARKNVQARMDEQDQRIAESRFTRADWLSKIADVARSQPGRRARCQEDGAGVSLGGGAYMSQEELYRIAERNVRPVIDDINQRAGEHHQLQRGRREEKTWDMQRWLDEGDKRILGSRRRQGMVKREGYRSTAKSAEEQAGATGPGEASSRGLGRARSHEGVDGVEVCAITGGQSTLLGRITGRSRAAESFGPLNHLGTIVRGRVVPKTRMEHSAALAGDVAPQSSGAPVSATTNHETRPDRLGSPVDADGKQHPSPGRGLLSLLKRPFGQQPQTADQDAPPAQPNPGSISRKRSIANRQSVGGVFFDRIRGSRALGPTTGGISTGHPETTTGPRNEVPMRDPTPEGLSSPAATNTTTQPTPTTADVGPPKGPIAAPTQDYITVGDGEAGGTTRVAEEDRPLQVASEAREDTTPAIVLGAAGIPEDAEVVLQRTVTETLTTEKTVSPDGAVSLVHKASQGPPVIEVAPWSHIRATASDGANGPEGTRIPPTIPEDAANSASTTMAIKQDIPEPSVSDAVPRTLHGISEENGEGSMHREVKSCPVYLNGPTSGADIEKGGEEMEEDAPAMRGSKFRGEL